MKLIKKYTKKIEQLNVDLAVHNEKIKDKVTYDSKLVKLNKLESKISSNLENHKKTLDFFEKNDNCPTCTQPIDKDFKTKKVKQHKIK